jgi:MFS family permease
MNTSTENLKPQWISTAWLIVFLLFPVAALNYLDRQMLATMKISVMTEIPSIGLEQNWGLMLGMFKWVYAIFSPIGGFVADRFSRKHVIAGSLLVWSAVTWATGHVHSYEQLLAARALMGISEACYIPAALALIADFHNGGTRSRAVGIHQMGIYTGVILGGFSGYVADADHLGWRLAFTLCGVVGVLYAVPLFLLLKNPPRQTSGEEAKHGSSPAKAARDLITNISFLLLVAYFTLPALAGWVVRDWMPAILQKEYNISQGLAGMSATLYWQIAAMIFAVLGGWLSDRWMKRTPRGRIYVSAIGMALIVPAMFGVGNAGTLTVAVLFLVLFGVGWGFFDCNNMPILCQVVRPELRATGYGFMNMISITFGGMADWIFGRLQDQNVPLNAIFGVFSGIAILSVVVVLLIRPRNFEESGNAPIAH